jgi:hypothetical protein
VGVGSSGGKPGGTMGGEGEGGVLLLVAGCSTRCTKCSQLWLTTGGTPRPGT